MKVAVLFPGQGAQDVGMGRDLMGVDEYTDGLLALASELTGEDMGRLCTRGPARRLAQTELLQPAMTAVCLSYFERLKAAGVRPDVVAGHSVGEIPGLSACAAVDPESAVRLACARGKAMGDAADVKEGAMCAVTGMPVDDVFARMEGVDGGSVTVATVNAPDQAVVSGDAAKVEEAQGLFKGVDGVRTKMLRVSGAWHSEHMRPAVDELARALDETDISLPAVSMVFNREGKEAREPAEIRKLIGGQLVSPVRWDLVMKRTAELGITDYIEVGPGKVLRGLLRLNFPTEDKRIHNVSDLRSLERTIKDLSA